MAGIDRAGVYDSEFQTSAFVLDHKLMETDSFLGFRLLEPLIEFKNSFYT